LEENFLYTTGWSDAMAAPGAAVNLVIMIGADAPFKCYYVTIHVAQGNEDCELLVADWAGDIVWRDNVIGKDLMNMALPIDALAGNGRDVYNLAPPRIFNMATTLTFTVTSNIATRTIVCIVLHGAKMKPA
jgi:hypothetical protein